jgi:hypothetical protein
MNKIYFSPDEGAGGGNNKEAKSVGMSWLAWILPFLLAAALVWWFLLGGKNGCAKPPASSTQQTNTDTGMKH